MTDLYTLIGDACSYADAEVPACSVCGYSSVPGLTADAGRVCEPCAMLRPRLAMRLDQPGGHSAVLIGDMVVGWVVSHPSGRWSAACDGRVAWTDSLDDALDMIGGWWR